ncbi:hypothetical protein KC19_VG307000 [Ceratodon purpureus]|uniref:Uncharacterized protein n=1 Tax=Ceratodon purpureus TaxID=3225 RepID=A0A8T0HV70_CERPU|nr:hypothetical protein KC19_VG307000 [Ceratodon purpureus]
MHHRHDLQCRFKLPIHSSSFRVKQQFPSPEPQLTPQLEPSDLRIANSQLQESPQLQAFYTPPSLIRQPILGTCQQLSSPPRTTNKRRIKIKKIKITATPLGLHRPLYLKPTATSSFQTNLCRASHHELRSSPSSSLFTDLTSLQHQQKSSNRMHLPLTLNSHQHLGYRSKQLDLTIATALLFVYTLDSSPNNCNHMHRATALCTPNTLEFRDAATISSNKCRSLPPLLPSAEPSTSKTMQPPTTFFRPIITFFPEPLSVAPYKINSRRPSIKQSPSCSRNSAGTSNLQENTAVSRAQSTEQEGTTHQPAQPRSNSSKTNPTPLTTTTCNLLIAAFFEIRLVQASPTTPPSARTRLNCRHQNSPAPHQQILPSARPNTNTANHLDQSQVAPTAVSTL